METMETSEANDNASPVITSSHVVVHDDLKNVALSNYDFESFITTFKSIEINISDFWLVNFGINAQGERKFAYLIIRAYSTRPFFGPHLVSIMTAEENEPNKSTMTTIWVHSLTFLRKELFQFHDRLSFERSTFLCPFEDVSCLIRLKGIRGFIQIRREAFQNAEITIRRGRSREKINALLNKNIQSLIAFLSREADMSIKDSIVDICNYTQIYCQSLLKQFS